MYVRLTRQCLGNGLIREVFVILQWLFGRKQEAEVGPFSAWNITGTYRGLPHALLHFFLRLLHFRIVYDVVGICL